MVRLDFGIYCSAVIICMSDPGLGSTLRTFQYHHFVYVKRVPESIFSQQVLPFTHSFPKAILQNLFDKGNSDSESPCVSHARWEAHESKLNYFGKVGAPFSKTAVQTVCTGTAHEYVNTLSLHALLLRRRALD